MILPKIDKKNNNKDCKGIEYPNINITEKGALEGQRRNIKRECRPE